VWRARLTPEVGLHLDDVVFDEDLKVALNLEYARYIFIHPGSVVSCSFFSLRLSLGFHIAMAGWSTRPISERMACA